MRDGGVDERELLMCPVGRYELNLPEQLESTLQRDGCSVLMALPGTIYFPPKPQISNIYYCFAVSDHIRNISAPALMSPRPHFFGSWSVSDSQQLHMGLFSLSHTLQGERSPP